MDISALGRYGQWLMRAAKEQGLLKYGMGPERLSRILEANPTLVLKSNPVTDRDGKMVSGTTGHIRATMKTPRGDEMSGFVQPIDRKSDVSSWGNTSPEAALFAKHGTPPNSKFGVAHMMGAEKGGGSSGVFYPAFGEMMAQEGRYLLPDTFITQDNLPNRFLKSIGTELNHQRPIFIPHEEQIGQGTFSPVHSIMDFAALPHDQRGALAFMEAQKRLEAKLLDNMDYARNGMLNGVGGYDPQLEKHMKRFMDITGMDPDIHSLGHFGQTGASLPEISEAVRTLRGMGVENVGPDTFRRGQAMRHMEAGTEAPLEIVDKLFFCKGGLAQMSQAERHVP